MIQVLWYLGKGWYKCDDGRGDLMERHTDSLKAEEIQAYETWLKAPRCGINDEMSFGEEAYNDEARFNKNFVNGDL